MTNQNQSQSTSNLPTLQLTVSNESQTEGSTTVSASITQADGDSFLIPVQTHGVTEEEESDHVPIGEVLTQGERVPVVSHVDR